LLKQWHLKYLFCKLSIIAVVASVTSCVKTELEVEYQLTRFPNSDFDGVNTYGVPKIEGLTGSEAGYLALQLRECRKPKPTYYVDALLDATWQNDKVLENSLERSVTSHPLSRKSQAILMVRVVKDDFQTSFKGTRLIKLKDKDTHAWYPGFGRVNQNFGGSLELAPQIKADTYTVDQKKDLYEIRLGYAVYHAGKKKVIFKDEVMGRIKVNSYSAEPPIDPAKAKKILVQNLLDQVVFRVCDAEQIVERKILATKGKGKEDLLLQEAIVAADDGKWKLAAEKWEQVLKVNKKNVLAHMNLGIYHEKSGDPVKAADFFRQYMKLTKKDELYDDVIEHNFELVDAKDGEPRIHAVSGGHWVTILGGWKDPLDVGKVYPVYRVRRVQDSKSRDVSGLELYQVGRIRIVKGKKPYYYARMLEYLAAYGVEIGDIVFDPNMPLDTTPKGKPGQRKL